MTKNGDPKFSSAIPAFLIMEAVVDVIEAANAIPKFPVLPITIPDIARKFPVLLRREFGRKPLILRPNNSGPSTTEARNWQNSLFFSLLAGNSDAETGSTVTASATTHSHPN
jgi:hypothetical protein